MSIIIVCLERFSEITLTKNMSINVINGIHFMVKMGFNILEVMFSICKQFVFNIWQGQFEKSVNHGLYILYSYIYYFYCNT